MDNFHRIVQAGEQRNHSRYTWLRYLVGLSAGFLGTLCCVCEQFGQIRPAGLHAIKDGTDE